MRAKITWLLTVQTLIIDIIIVSGGCMTQAKGPVINNILFIQLQMDLI